MSLLGIDVIFVFTCSFRLTSVKPACAFFDKNYDQTSHTMDQQDSEDCFAVCSASNLTYTDIRSFRSQLQRST
jgi:hypothetical protein